VMATALQPPQEISFSFDPWLKSNLNFGEPDEHVYRNGRLARQGSVVCKHWLKGSFHPFPLISKHFTDIPGLCKKGDACEFLHEYNIRKMPECKKSRASCLPTVQGYFFNKHGYCQNLEECLYRHIDPVSRIGVCPWYERGFCPLGPDCSKRHVKGRRICQMFLTGFCPLGRECHDAQYVPFPFPLKTFKTNL
jgi:cleavage and polyadenylation specificity factor subunit 4